MVKMRINYLFLAISLVVIGIMLYLFVSLSDNTGYAIATPLLIMFPLTLSLAVSFEGSPRMTANVKILSEVFSTLLFITGILACIFNFASATYVAFTSFFFLAWLGLSWLLAFRTKG